jgi:poly(3-hydroxybutyrate) depolymerase
MNDATRAGRTALAALAGLALTCTGCTGGADTPVPAVKVHEPVTDTSYHLYVPSDADALGPLPVAVVLHGGGFDSAAAQVRQWKGLAEGHGFAVLAPELKSPGALSTSAQGRREQLATDAKRILAALDDATGRRRLRVNEQAVFIAGYGRGGDALYYTASQHPDRFDALVALSCRADLEVLQALPVTDELRATPMLITWPKTGTNPLNSNWNPVVNQSWAAYRHLRMNKCYKVERLDVRGGHFLKPEVAVSFWRGLRPGAFADRQR